MEKKYTNEVSTLQLIALMKEHGIKKVIASPGNTNISFVGSIQNDPYFEIYSCVDERSAAYIACGLAEESGEPVALSCTGATAARNYPSGLTEAFYRKLPVLAITSSQPFGRVGQLIPQFTDRNIQFNDIATLSVQIPYPYSDEEKWSNNVKINNALLQLKRNGGGPVHINLATLFSKEFNVISLPYERVIRRYYLNNTLPDIKVPKICIFVGSHSKFSLRLERAVDEFCEKYNAVVLCDQTSNYRGKYRILGGMIAGQNEYYPACRKAELTIHLGEITGGGFLFKDTEVWRVSQDGEVRDPFRLLTNIFEMEEVEFFEYYNSLKEELTDVSFYLEWIKEQQKLFDMLPELPLSNAWLCQMTAPRLPEGSVLHLGILNSLRSWNLFDTPNTVYSYSNVGGFGIDGVLSSCIGASLGNADKLYFCVIGDLATFYDINIFGNRHIRNNVRILVVNNGTGYEMHCAGSIGKVFGDDADRFFAAGGHFGKQSRDVLKHFTEDLGFEYISADSKEEYLAYLDYFVSSNMHKKPIVFEVFVNKADEDFAYNVTKNIVVTPRKAAKKIAKNILGEKGYSELRKIVKS